MTNKIFSMVDGKRIGFAPNLTPRLHRVDSVSIVSRQSLLPILLLCLTLFLGVGNAWGDESWDLTTNSYSSSSTSTVTWNGTNATMTLEKNGGTNANNYLGGSGTYTHTRVYNKNILRITPASGKTISSIEITATSNSYTIVGTWTNGSASSSGSKTTVTPTDGTKAVYCTCSDTKRLTGVVVKFGSSSSLEQVTISGNPTLKNYEAGDVFDPAGLTVTGTYSNSTNSDIEDGITWTAYNGSSYVALSDAPLTQGQTTLKVKATVGAVTSAEFTVTNLSVVAAYSKVTITQSQVTSFTNKYAEYSWSANSVSGKLNAYKNSGMQFNTGNNTTSTGYVYNTVAVPGKIVYITMTTASGTERSWTPYVSSSALTPSNYSTAGTALTSQTVKTTGTRWNVTGDNSYFYLLPPSSASVISSIVVAYESCTELGSINGSFSFTNVSPTSVTVGVPSDYEDKDDSNLTGYIFKRYAASTGGDALETIETNSASGTSATFNTNLVANTTYYYTITAKHESSSCNSAETSPRKSYKIDSYVVSYANGGGSGTNPGAHDPVLANGKVTLKSNTFDAPTGKEFRVWNDGTSDLDEGEEFTVTANTTMTAQWECMEPGFTKNLSTTQVNYLQGETAAKLSVTATANGAELSYAWEMSANGTTGWSSVGTNSNEYTPSTATAGDQYYHCIVTNLADGCTESKATSAVAHIHVDVPAACLEPVISVASDTYYEDKSVTITCGTVGAAIYYTTDGSTTPTSGSTLYEGAITVDHSMTIKAIAIKAGMDNSTVAEATYTIKCETPTIVLAAGNYTGVQTTTITKGYGTKIYYTTDGTTPSNTNGTEYTGAVSIDQPMTLKAIVWKDGCTNSEVASAAYTLKCTTPEFNKGTDTYTGAQSITLSGTAGADIYYTLDGTTPSKTNGTKYTAAIEVSANQTVKAIAVKEGWGDSEIASATYTIQYNVYWWVNGVAWTEKGGSTLVTYGQTATAPTTAPTKADGCGDKFMGWTETQNYENDNTAPMDMFTETSAAITGETNFYAVFADYGEDE